MGLVTICMTSSLAFFFLRVSENTTVCLSTEKTLVPLGAKVLNLVPSDKVRYMVGLAIRC